MYNSLRAMSREKELTPLRRQYLRIKQRYPEAILLFRLGDFYEAFDEDARIVSRELEIVLTSREMGKGQRFPMAGIPHHALESYLGRLVRKGYKVAICEQLGDPATSKGLVDRDVIRVVTPGTVIEPGLLEQKSNNYLVALVTEDHQAGLAFVDITTGEFATTQLAREELGAELERLAPAEVLVPRGQDLPVPELQASITTLDPWLFDLEVAQGALLEHFGVATLEGYGCGHLPLAVRAAGAVIQYLRDTQKDGLKQILSLSTYSTSSYMTLDPQTRRNLELFQGGRWGATAHSLFSILDLTRTPMGGRLLKKWIASPLLDLEELNRRQEAVDWFYQHPLVRERFVAELAHIPDLERLISRVQGGHASPREVVALRRGLERVPKLRALLEEEGAPSLCGLQEALKPCGEVVDLIARALVEEPTSSIGEGGVIKEGFSPDLDQLRSATRNARDFLADLEGRERERTGIKSLKVGYNKVFGYYIEVTKPHLSQVPGNYLRRQTLVGAERFITPELKEYETFILNAQDRIQELETALFRQVCQQIGGWAHQLMETARALALGDVLAALAEAATRYGYTRPQLTLEGTISIKGGRHPIVERTLPPGTFVPNDVYLSPEEAQLLIITGPNMSGKSTFIRQVALIVLMAQIGSFVPADAATIGLVDRIFTRVGLQDDLAVGQSTFMVEMVETANILHHATPRSLVILDEIGRGTSTYDGLAIAWAVAEHLHNHPRLRCKTLFATHYHELTQLPRFLPRAKNYNVAVVEEDGQVVFLHRIVPGAADRSYGIHVAQLAGLPHPVVRRAWELLAQLEAQGRRPLQEMRRRSPRGRDGTPFEQLPLFPPVPQPLQEIAEELRTLDPDSLTPLEALSKLYQWRRRAEESYGLSNPEGGKF